MKYLINISIALFGAILLFSCRNNDIPEDIHEHEEIERLIVTVVEKGNAENAQTINYIGGKEDKSLVLENGKSYDVSLDFQVKHDDHYHSVNEEIIEEKDEHFILYSFANIDVQLKRSSDDEVRKDGNKLGLITEWTVKSATKENAVVEIILNHGATSVNQNSPSSENQLGSVTGGESDVYAKIKVVS